MHIAIAHQLQLLGLAGVTEQGAKNAELRENDYYSWFSMKFLSGWGKAGTLGYVTNEPNDLNRQTAELLNAFSQH